MTQRCHSDADVTLQEASPSGHGRAMPEEAQDTVNEVFVKLIHPRGSGLHSDYLDSPTRGSTRCLGDLPIEFKYGEFTAYAFETAIDGKHLLVLAKGDITTSDPLLTRIHSECITSETLGGCDCDCVEQLDASLKLIAEEGRGVLFYLRQEGRGAGYSSKGRDRMVVASSGNQVETFEAYRCLGLPADARCYEPLAHVAYLLDITAPLRVMTNNPDKLAGLEALGFEISEHCSLSVPPNPFNAYYLASKGRHGHMLDVRQERGADYPWSVEPFTPHRLASALRFTHNASYPLPIKPVNGTIILDAQAAQELKALDERLGTQAILHLEELANGRVRVSFDRNRAKGLEGDAASESVARFIAEHSYWFNDHIYSDSVTGWDYVALDYNRERDITPLIRIHSESLFNRFPLKDDRGPNKYHRSIQAIVEHGRGLVLLYPEDGKGNGFGTAFMEKRLVNLGVAQNTVEASKILGLQSDTRDYEPAVLLIKHHYGARPIRLIVGSAESLPAKESLIKCLAEHGIETLEPLFLAGK